ncbi:YIR protein [Plasmodium yoelii]|uniref:YIR protein n=1 Tax=Plasmodium yoelii TaxID=5861 RepID=A0A077X8B5_PLAYE|nr:YIR protein [Plasmodium yoelii]
MNEKVCRNFFAIRNSISDQLNKDGNYQLIIENNLNGYCSGNKCEHELEKVNAGCLYLFDAFFKNSSVFNYHNNINVVYYIMIWLSHMLNLKENNESHISALNHFYNTYINNDKYKNTINDVTGYNSYKDLIDKKKLMNMDIKIISKFYDAFNTLCMLYIEFDDKSPDCNKYLKYADEFDKKYKKLNKDPSITVNNSYNQLLCTLSTDYDNFKKKYSNVQSCKSSPLPTIEKCVQSSEVTSAQTFEVASSSSTIGNKLFIVLSIFGAIAFLLGISYKYSLFGFRKRFQKQKLREKIKNIKKRINH